MPDSQDQPEFEFDAAAKPGAPVEPAKKAPAKKTPAKNASAKPAKKAPAKTPPAKAAKKAPAKKAPAKQAPAPAAESANGQDPDRIAAGAKEAAAQAKSTVESAQSPVIAAAPTPAPRAERSPTALVAAVVSSLLALLVIRRVWRRRAR